MLVRDDATPSPKLHFIELTITADRTTAGIVHLRAALRGGEPVELAIPERPDQIEWIDPDHERLEAPTPSVAWSAWRADNAGLALASRPSVAQRPSRHVRLDASTPAAAEVDVRAALEELHGPGAFTRGWCVRAWLVGGAHPLPSNILCWPAG